MKEAVLCAALVLAGWAAALAGEGAKATRFDAAKVREARPRIWLDAERVDWLKEKMKGKTLDEVKALAGSSTTGKALVYVVTGDEKSGREAVEAARAASDNERNIATMAVCYDWCHALLSEADRKAFAGRMIESGKKLIAFGRNWRSFHNGLYSSAWPTTAVAIALYGDEAFADEAWAFLKPELEDVMRTFDNVFPDGEWGEGVDYNRHSTYEALKFFWAIKTATGLDVMASSQHMRNTGLFIAYGMKPDGLNLPINDNDFPFIGWWEREALLLSAAEYKDPYCQYVLNHCPVLEFQPAGRNKWMELLWYDPELREKSVADLPPSRIFRGMGLVIARSGWGWDTKDGRASDTWVSFRCGDYYGDHCHYDQNRFEIYYKGPLAIESGRYDDDWDHYGDEPFKKSQFFNYYQRTIAHNTILVYDPDEEFAMPIVNDGGQRQMLIKDGNRNVPEDYDQGTFPSDDGVGTCDWAANPGRWETGDVVAYEATKDFMYVRGDATAAYSAEKVKSFVRQLFFLQSDLVVVFDRVVSAKPEFKKTWVLQSVNEPAFGKSPLRIEVTNGGGKLVCLPMLPEAPELKKAGLPGNAFMVGGVEFTYGPESPVAEEPLHFTESITGDMIGETPGKWRVEECPAAPAEEDYFLNVMMVMDEDSERMPAATVTKNDASGVEVEISNGLGTRAVITFAKGPGGATSLKLARDGKVLFEGAMPNEIVLEKGRP